MTINFGENVLEVIELNDIYNALSLDINLKKKLECADYHILSASFIKNSRFT